VTSAGIHDRTPADDCKNKMAAAFGLSTLPAHAGPCTAAIAQFEQGVKRAEERAQAMFAATLARAKRLDARGNRSGCRRALTAAKRMYNF
jgi:hypothetical protein